MNEVKKVLENKLEHELKRRGKDIGQAIQKMEATGQMLNDYLVPSRRLRFESNGKSNLIFEDLQDGIRSFGLHRNAVSQLAVRFGLNARDLQREATGTEWERKVFVDRMNAYTTNAEARNMLVREVKGEARAVLSDRYRRMNTAQIFMSFLMAAKDSGSVLVDANHGDLRDFLEVIHPQVIEVPTEKNGIVYTAFGAQIRNSDFGASALDLRIYQMNVVCLNGLVSKSMINQRHLGSKMEDVGNVTYTKETMDADTKARALAVRDIMSSLYSEENIKRERQKIFDASQIELDFPETIKKLPKMGLYQAEADMLTKTLMESDANEGVTGANTLWKMAQGLTSVANKVEDSDRKRDLQDIASGMLAEYVN